MDVFMANFHDRCRVVDLEYDPPNCVTDGGTDDLLFMRVRATTAHVTADETGRSIGNSNARWYMKSPHQKVLLR